MTSRAPLSSRPVNTTTSSSMSRLTKPTASSAAASAQTLTAKRKRDELAAAAPRAATSSTASRVAAARSTSSTAAPSAKRAKVEAPTSSRSSASSSGSSSSSAAASKRPAWDIKGRVQDLEALSTSLQSTLHNNNETIEALRHQLSQRDAVVGSLEHNKEQLQQNLSGYQQQIDESQRQQQQLLHRLEMAKMEHNSQMSALQSQHRSLQFEHDSLTTQHRLLQDDCARYRATIQANDAQIAELTSQAGRLTEDLEKTRTTLSERESMIVQLNEQLQQQADTIAQLESKRREDEMVRRRLHNHIQDLKGNIRVYCRVRPALGSEGENVDELEAFSFPESNGGRALEIDVAGRESLTGKATASRKQSFTFDKVFAPSATQAQVFEEISALVQSSLDGYNTCIFTYGVTGSGKTYTMEGPDNPTEHSRGMIPRAVQQIFECAAMLREQGWEYEFTAFFLEIYNESIRDLLVRGEPKDVKYDIKHNRDGTTTVTNLTTYRVEAPDQVHELLRRASHNRAVASTNCNERSSRSHSVFQLKIDGKNTITGAVASGLLNLIDLAGSERLANSGSTGDRLKETMAINKSLSSLGDVICALANKDQHVPYRNSKLTYLLQRSLGGNSKTLMFVNISPKLADLNETLSSLRFATKVNACEIGIARKGGRVSLED